MDINNLFSIGDRGVNYSRNDDYSDYQENIKYSSLKRIVKKPYLTDNEMIQLKFGLGHGYGKRKKKRNKKKR